MHLLIEILSLVAVLTPPNTGVGFDVKRVVISSELLAA